MKASNLLLINYVIKDLEYSLIDEFTDKKVGKMDAPALTVKSTFAVVGANEGKHRCEIDIRLNEKSTRVFPYHFRLKMAGDFAISTEIDAASGERLFRVNAPALLYSAAREIIFNLSSHSGHPPFLLPSVTFVDEMEPKAVEPAPTVAKKPVRKKKS